MFSGEPSLQLGWAFYYTLLYMHLIKIENYDLKVSDEALLVKPIRKLFHQDRSKGKEQFYKQMSILFFVYSPMSNYSYIVDEKERLKEVCEQEGIKDFKMTADFKEAVEVYKKLVITPEALLLEDTNTFIDKSRKVLRDINYDELDDIKDKVTTMKTGMAIADMVPKLVKNLAEAKKIIEKEQEETGNARGSQELTIGDLGMN